MRLAFVYLPGRCERLPQLARGEVPSEFFYGAVELAAAGHAIEYFELPPHSRFRVVAAALDLLRRGRIAPPKLFGHAIVNAWSLSAALDQFDCVIATVGHHAFALAVGAVAGRLRAPLVAIQCGLLHHPFPLLRRRITRALLNRMDSVLFGEAEHAPMLAELDPEPARLAVNQFGVDLDFWKPGGVREDFVLAIGNDLRRDFPTLLNAAPQIGAPMQIVTRLKLPEPLPANVTALRGSWHDRALSDVDIRSLYQRAACVVVPLHDTLQPSGQSVALQAMACGAPLVLTETRGLWNPTALRANRPAILVPPGDPLALAAAVSAVLQDPARATQLSAAGRAYAQTHGNIRDFARGMEQACERAVARAKG